MSAPTVILWFRRDLRLADNPALSAALTRGRVLPVYIHAPEEDAPWQPGAASDWWLHHSLAALDRDLRERGSRLLLRRGPSLPTLLALCAESGARAVYWNRCHSSPGQWALERQLKPGLAEQGIEGHSHNAAFWHQPWGISKADGGPFKVFTAYWRRARRDGLSSRTLPRPATLAAPPDLAGPDLDGLGLRPAHPWAGKLAAHWQPGEAGAAARLQAFLPRLDAYAEARDLPAQPATSRLAAHLHFGELGPRQLLAAIQARHGDAETGGVERFLAELGWREFAHHLLFHFPHTTDSPLDPRYRDYPWRDDPEALHRWQRGETGIPLVDAGMRELWATGSMHNRVRMVVASFLTKNLQLPWQQGARWFWDTLVDADLANNTLGWQWTAGCGADAAPYFRVFNPVTQGRRFDPRGDYVRHWLPELAGLPDRQLHAPWEAPVRVREAAGLRLGRDYPAPMVDLAESRRRALAGYQALRGAANAPLG